MSDLISRKAAIEVLKTEMEHLDYGVQHAIGGTKECDLLVAIKEQIYYNINTLEDLPDAEPERKKGECTKINCPIQMDYISNDCDIKTCPYRTERQIGKWKNVALFTRECSECGAQFHELEYDNFCPNCGADMRQQDIPMEYFENGGI